MNPLGPWAAGSEVVEVRTDRRPQGREKTAVDTAGTRMVHVLLELALADKMSVKYFEPQVARAEVVGLGSLMLSSMAEPAQEREVQGKHDQHGLAANREPY